MNFEDFSLDARILAGVKSAGFTEPTPIQEQAIPVVLQGKDVLGLAQTGTGKTAAFALPILQKLSTGPLRRTRVLVVAPRVGPHAHQLAGVVRRAALAERTVGVDRALRPALARRERGHDHARPQEEGEPGEGEPRHRG